MSFLHMSLKQEQKASYCSLLFEKILRKYENKSPMASGLKRVNSKSIYQNNVDKINSEKSQNNKTMIDLNRKIKINRISSKDSSKDSESNKQNVGDNGATYSYNSGYSDHRQHSDILKSFQDKNKDLDERSFLDVNQFIQYENNPKVEQISKKAISEEKDNQQKLKIEIMDEDDLPDLILPNKQPSKCELFRQQRLVQNFDILPIIQQQVFIAQEQRVNTSKNNQSKRHQNSHQIKTKLSLRILKKKLKKYTIQQVVNDVIKHRRIQLDGFYSEPQKQAVCQALMSFMKSQVIN